MNKDTLWVNVSSQPKKSPMQKKVERLIKKAEKQGYSFNDIDLGMFAALGRENWNEEKVNWLALQHFESLYSKFYHGK